MKALAFALLAFLSILSDSPAGAYGTTHGPDDPELLRNGLKIECSRSGGRTFFQVHLIPLQPLEAYEWFSQLVLWKDRKNAIVEVSCVNPQFPEKGILCSFSIEDSRMADADFEFQSQRKGNPGLFYKLDLPAFLRATKDKATFPKVDH